MMNNRVMWMCVVIASGTICASGCKSDEQKSEEASWRMDTPLAHDPTDDDQLAPWWSNGRQLLNLKDDGSYALYEGTNRYRKPAQRGRWGQNSYAFLLLEPYSRDLREPTRVGITKIGGRLALRMPETAPMYAFKSAPKAGEDQLIGEWQGTMGTLQLSADSTYAFRPAPGAVAGSNGAGIVAGHNGKWRMENQQVILAPATPSVEPISLTVRESEASRDDQNSEGDESPSTMPAANDITLEGLGGELVKIKAAST